VRERGEQSPGAAAIQGAIVSAAQLGLHIRRCEPSVQSAVIPKDFRAGFPNCARQIRMGRCPKGRRTTKGLRSLNARKSWRLGISNAPEAQNGPGE